MYRCLITAMLIFFVLTSKAQQTSPAWGWAKSFSGSGTERCWDVAADSRNSIYSFGTFTSDTLFLKGQLLVAPGGGIFLLRHDTLGNLIWAQRFGNINTSDPAAASVTTDIQGQVLITGSFSGTISFGAYNLTSAGGTDVFVVKIKPNGTVTWAKKFSGTLDDSGGPVDTDEEGNIFTAGNFKSSTLTIGSSVLFPPGAVKLYYCALDSNGNSLWAQSASSAANCNIYDLAVFKSGKIIMGGNIESGGSLSFAPGGANSFFTVYHSVFTVQISAAGNYISQAVTGAGTRFFSGGLAINKQQQYIEAGYSTFLSTNPPIANTVLRDTNYAGITGNATSRLNPAGPVTAFDVITDNQSRVSVLASNIGNNSFGSGLSLSSSNSVSALWELDSMLVTRALLATNYQPGISSFFRRIAKDTLTGTLYIAGYIDAFNPGGNYIIGDNTLTHVAGLDACIVQVRKVNAALTLQARAGNDTVTCPGQPVPVGSASATGGVAPFTYSWLPVTGVANPAAASTTVSPNIPTQYILTVTDFAGNTARDTVMVNVLQPFTLSPADTTIYHNCPGETSNLLTLYNTAGLSTSWNTATPQAVPPGTWRLIAANAAGCRDTAIIKVVLEAATWTGNVNSSWHTAGNWSTGKVPSANTHVIIPVTSANGCEVYLANGIAASLQVRNGGQLVFLNGMSVTVIGTCAILPP